jgi:hypothetical protein
MATSKLSKLKRAANAVEGAATRLSNRGFGISEKISKIVRNEQGNQTPDRKDYFTKVSKNRPKSTQGSSGTQSGKTAKRKSK